MLTYTDFILPRGNNSRTSYLFFLTETVKDFSNLKSNLNGFLMNLSEQSIGYFIMRYIKIEDLTFAFYSFPSCAFAAAKLPDSLNAASFAAAFTPS